MDELYELLDEETGDYADALRFLLETFPDDRARDGDRAQRQSAEGGQRGPGTVVWPGPSIAERPGQPPTH